MLKKKILDLLYTEKHTLTVLANEEKLKSHQLPQEDVSGRNLATGRSLGYQTGAQSINDIIKDVIYLEE